MRYEESPVGEVTKTAKHDMDLIREDVEAGRWSSVIEGVEYQVKAFTSLLDSLRTLEAGGHLKEGKRRSFVRETPAWLLSQPRV